MGDDIIEKVELGEKLWPYNAHLIEHPRIEDYVRLVLRDRWDAARDEPALITPLGLGDAHGGHRGLPGFGDCDSLIGLQTHVVMYPTYEPDAMLASMDYVTRKGVANGGNGFVCAECSNRIPGQSGSRRFEIIWVSVPPSIVGVALCPPCAEKIIEGYNPMRVI